MRSALAPVLLASLFLGAAADKEDAAKPPPVGVEIHDEGSARVLSAVLPGTIEAQALLPGSPPRFVARVKLEDETERLVSVTLGDEPELREWPLDLGDDPGPIFDGSPLGQADTLLFARGGSLHALSLTTGDTARLLELDVRRQAGVAPLPNAPFRAGPVGLEVGQLVPLRAADTGVEALPPVPLPITARRLATGLRLDSPRVTEMARPDGPPLYLVGPEAQGHRLRTLVVDPAAPEDARSFESWARLPGPEEVQYSWYVRLDDRLRLVVLTKRSDRLGVFEKMALRVFPIVADPTRGGRNALLRAETETIWWNRPDVVVADVDGDGSEELVLLQPEGLGGSDLVLDAYARGPSTGFAVTPRSSKAKDADSCWAYGRDVTGDGQPDLVVGRSHRLLIHPGIARQKKRGVVEKKPEIELRYPADTPALGREITIGTGGADASANEHGCGLELVDLGGDRAEILVVHSESGRGRVRLVRLQ